MAVTFRTPAVPSEFDRRLREAADAALTGDWRITVLQSHLDGQWNVQLEGPGTRCRIVLTSLERTTVSGLTVILKHLAAADAPGFTRRPQHPVRVTGDILRVESAPDYRQGD